MLARLGKNSGVFPLSLLSPEDSRFDRWKELSLQIAYYYSCSDIYFDKAFKIHACGNNLIFNRSANNYLTLRYADFCRQRFCLLCSWRRRRRWINKIRLALEEFLLVNDCHAVFLTLSQRNCSMEALNREFKGISRAWGNLVKFSSTSKYSLDFPFSYIKTYEVTKSIDLLSGNVSFHPHIHALLFVPCSYFQSRYYIPQNSSTGRMGWVQRWQQALGVDYLPTAHVKGIPIDYVGRAINQTCKYLLKPDSFIDRKLECFRPGITTNILDKLTSGTKGIRAISVGGDFKNYIRNLSESPDPEEENEDLIHVAGSVPDYSREGRFAFKWAESPIIPGYYSYLLTER